MIAVWVFKENYTNSTFVNSIEHFHTECNKNADLLLWAILMEEEYAITVAHWNNTTGLKRYYPKV